MRLLPAIDLKNGRCVRLLRGDFACETAYPAAPLALARKYRAMGADWLHVVDLDGAREGRTEPGNRALIAELARESGLKLQVGGGLRTHSDVERVLEAGAARAVIGSAALQDPAEVREWVDDFGRDRIVLALDVRLDAGGTPCIVTHGWQRQTSRSLWDALAAFPAPRAIHVLCTDVGRDGALSGPNVALYAQAAGRFPRRRLASLGRHTGCGRFAGSGRKRRCRGHQRQGTAGRSHSHRGAAAILAKRIIPCLDVRDGRVVKGVRFREHRVVGEIMDLALRYRDAGADELVFYDITASPQARSVDRRWIERVARILDIPFCVAGGIRSVADAEEVLASGAEKISVNSPALARSGAHRCAEPALRHAMCRGRNRQSNDRRRVSSPAIHRRRHAHLRCRTQHSRLGDRGATARCRRDRSELHGERRRAPGVRYRAAERGARRLSRPARGLRGRGPHRAFRTTCSAIRPPTRRWLRASFIPGTSPFPISSGHSARTASR